MKSEQTLTVRDILQRPLFLQAKLIAGNKGITRSVGWIHILEITNAKLFTNQHDLILTTGLGIHEHTEIRMMYLQELINQKAAGLCIELGPYLPSVPQDMIDLAEQHDFPLIVFETPVRFVDITQDIHALLINKQYQILKDLELFSRKLQQLTLESTNIQAILRLLHEHTSAQVIYYSLIDKPIFSPSVSPKIAQDLIARYRFEVDSNPSSSPENSLLTINEKKTIVSQPVICLGQTLSHVGIIVHDQAPTDYMVLLLDYAGKAVAHILLRKLFLEQKTSENHTQLINDILQYKVENEEQAMARIGLRPLNKGKYLFIAGIIEIEHSLIIDEEELEAKNQDIVVLLRSLLSKNGIYNLVLSKNNQIYLLCIRESFASAVSPTILKEPLLKTLEQLQNAIKHNLSKHIRIRSGFGLMKEQLVHTSQSFKEAFDALSVARKLPDAQTSPFYEEIGIYQLFKGMSDVQQLSYFVTYHLGDVIEYDKRNHSSLLETLDKFLSCMGAKQETAEQLFIHRQTLYHRLEKLEELLGENYLRPDNRICLEIALRAYDLLGKESSSE
ncbi:PucR family transcriptional regulator [Paenibacillus rigui]|uniref:PucR family transcriptional regulator n=1 Tax=Paenibacillus rigui TaxID=554312 RepID=UPI0015C65798|nr:PucR family transcriptional regulator [Paenibacillus rigui]